MKHQNCRILRVILQRNVINSNIFKFLNENRFETSKFQIFFTFNIVEMSNCDDYKFSLNQNFVNADADTVLPNWNSCRSNLTLEMNALILCGLIDAGLIDVSFFNWFYFLSINFLSLIDFFRNFKVLSGLITANPNRSLSFKILLMLVDIFVEVEIN